MANQFISASYKLYDISDGSPRLIEETQEGHPITFVSGLGIVAPALEKLMESVPEGGSFDYTLEPAEGFGEYVPEYRIKLDKSLLSVDGRFDDERIRPGAVVPLVDQKGRQYSGRVLQVEADKVDIDMNHPLAGCRLRFVGKVEASHEASDDEAGQWRQATHKCHSGGHCCHHHDGEGGHCHHHDGEEGHCGGGGGHCGGHHHDGECQCGHCANAEG